MTLEECEISRFLSVRLRMLTIEQTRIVMGTGAAPPSPRL